MNDFSLPRAERLRHAKDFDRVFRQGKVLQSDFFTVMFVENGLDYNRIAVMVKKKFGKAHDRNKVRRWVKEAYRTMKNELAKGFDLIILPRKALSEVFEKLSYFFVQEELYSLLKRIGK
ncbi:MAG TPA: ribonuclease P protein component [Pseudothermotoga sp.]|nr:ribonuclease P protein component [Pseudothermotoga sp.]